MHIVSTYTELPDDQLLATALTRNQRAFGELIRRYRGLIYRCITRVTGRYERVLWSECIDDIFAEVCVLLWDDDLRRLRAYDPLRGMKLSSWIGLIAGHATYDHLRRLARRPPHEELDDQPADLCATHEDPLARLITDERRRELRRLSSGLSRRDREFVSIYFQGDGDPEEVARALGISVKTVYSKKNKITTRLLELAA